MEPQAYRIALVPFPSTMLSCLGYLVWQLRGLINDQTLVFYHWWSNRDRASKPSYQETVALFGDTFEQELKRYIQNKPKLLFLFNRMCNPGTREGQEAQRYLQRVLREYWQYPHVVMDYCVQHLKDALRERHLGSMLRPLSTGVVLHGFADSWHGNGEQFFTLPVRQNQQDHRSPITGWRTANLPQSPIGYLRNQSLVVAIGGPPNSGKSTLAATLSQAANNLIRTIQSQEQDELDLDAIYFDMDAGTPTTQAIATGGRVDSETIHRVKRPWTDRLALQTLKQLQEARRPGRIIFADLPGRLTEITEILVVPADVSVIITNDWRRMSSWRRFMNRNGKDPLGIIRSRLRPRDDSAVTMYVEHRSVSGRLTFLTRLMKPENEFVRPFIVILMLDLLPSLIRTRRKILERFIHDPTQGPYKSYEPE